MIKKLGLFSAAILAALALAQAPAQAAERNGFRNTNQYDNHDQGRRVIVPEQRFDRNRVEYRIPERRVPVGRIVVPVREHDCR